MDDDELRKDLDELADELVTPDRADRTIEDQGETGAVRGDGEPDDEG